MNTIRISGLVNIANHIRQELSRAVSAERREELRKRVKNTLHQVDDILKQAQATADGNQHANGAQGR